MPRFRNTKHWLNIHITCCLVALGCTSPPAPSAGSWPQEQQRLDSLIQHFPSELEQVTYLRKYCGALIDIGRPNETTRQLYQSVNLESFNLDDFYPLFRHDSIPAACGITTFFYIKLLQSLGFKAYQYSFGFTHPPYERFIHSVALVEINIENTKKLIIQDPYLNLSFKKKNGDHLDFLEFLSLIENKQYHVIEMDSSSLTTSLLVPDTSLYYPYLNDSCKTLLENSLTTPNGQLKRKMPITRNYTTLMQSPCDDFEQSFTTALKENGFAEPLLYAYRLQAAPITGNPDYNKIQMKIDALLNDKPQ